MTSGQLWDMSEIIKYHLQPVSVNSEEIIFSLSTLKKFSLNPSLKRREAPHHFSSRLERILTGK
jgi:hypothetical protein